MLLFEIGFWICIVLILYPYLIYPLILLFIARVRPKPVRRGANGPRAVSIVICVHNEQDLIERRLTEFLDTLERGEFDGEIIVVCDGSTDDTAAVVRPFTKHTVRLIDLPQRVGKADALNRGVAIATKEIVVFADARQTWAPDALERLLENYADDRVGAVSGDLVVTAAPGTMSGVGLYWRYEKWLRGTESKIGSQIGVTGAISACRRHLYLPIMPGTLLDDVYWPLQVAMKKYRVIHDTRAIAYDRLPEKTRDEFRRKVRTLAGNFQLVARLPHALLPWRNPVWMQLVSHKLARLVVPWALIGSLVCCFFANGKLYDFALFAQGVAYLLGFAGFWMKRGRWLTSASSFLVLNAAAFVAFWVWISGRSGQSWQKVAYQPVPMPDPLANGPSRQEAYPDTRTEERTSAAS
jgi:cellulose synthase/poly-beta-1,6-N-acetylglucosamine synthase-like glycosyltransferase